MSWTTLILLLGIGIRVVTCAGFPRHATSVQESDLQSEYDFIVVGGGASGLTVADRLTEDLKSRTSLRT